MRLAHTPHGDVEYRLDRRGDRAVVVYPGGHMDARVRLGEDYFSGRGFTIVTVSRPGYGRTPLSTGSTPDRFADAVAELLRSLDIRKVVAVGISAGGRAAVQLAARHPELVEALLLQSAVSFARWPAGVTKYVAPIVFNPRIERYTWRAVHWLLRRFPTLGLRLMLGSMTTRRAGAVVRGLTPEAKRELIALFRQLRSRTGFARDLAGQDDPTGAVAAPTLIIHSKWDKSVPIAHARRLHAQIRGSRLCESDAESHLIWFSPHYAEVEKVMDDFLTRGSDPVRAH